MITTLRDAMVSHLNRFKSLNANHMPKTIIVYRDGVSEGQFDQVSRLIHQKPLIYMIISLSWIKM